jgi:hypothetical protein
MARKVWVSWPELGIRASATLAEAENPELCEEFWRSLPFGIVQSHPTVSGSSVTMWLPYLSKAPTPGMEAIVDAPLGRIRLSQGTGSKLSIQYGRGLEPAKQAVLGQIDDGFLGLLEDVGRQVWDNLFWRKQRMTVHFAPYEEGDKVPQRPALAHPLSRRLCEAADAIQLDEPRDITRLRTGDVPDAGSFGQYFSVWDAAHGLVRDFVTNTLYPIYQALPRLGVEGARTTYGVVAAKYHFPLGYHGFVDLAEYAKEFHAVLEAEDDPAVVGEVFEQLLRFGNATYAWSHQCFPWFVGMQFPTPGSEGVGGVWKPSPS